MTTSTSKRPPRIPGVAYEITVTVQNRSTSQSQPTSQSRSVGYTTRRVHASALQGLPEQIDPAHLPSYRLEVVDPTTQAILYQRPYARPGYVEAYGPDSAWTRLPAGHTQVLVTLIPAFRKLQESQELKGLRVVAYEPSTSAPWLDITLR